MNFLAKDIKINEFIEVENSFRKFTQARKIDDLLENLQAADLLKKQIGN